MSMKLIPPLIRIKSKSERKGACLVYTGSLRNGYGVIWYKGKTKYVHRVVWESLKGKIPKDLVIDHKCRTRNCFNLSHLRVVTPKENIDCGMGISGINSRKKSCEYGHKFDKENTLNSFTYQRKTSIRICRACSYLRLKKYRMIKSGKTGYITDGIRIIYVSKIKTVQEIRNNE